MPDFTWTHGMSKIPDLFIKRPMKFHTECFVQGKIEIAHWAFDVLGMSNEAVGFAMGILSLNYLWSICFFLLVCSLMSLDSTLFFFI